MTAIDKLDASGHAISPYHGPLRVGIGGPVGSGKTALAEVCANGYATSTIST